MKSFEEFKKQTGRKVRICVAAAQDEELVKTIKEAQDLGIGQGILVGDKAKIEGLMAKVGLTGAEVVNEPDEKAASLKAATLVGHGEADVLMKGLVNSSDFLRAVLNEGANLRTGSLLSHLAAFEIPSWHKLAFVTDGGMVTYPDVEAKVKIIKNALNSLHNLGMANPYVAICTANEVVNPKMQPTVDAAELMKLFAAGEFPGCTMEGPMAMDVALSAEAAAHKKLESKISGEVDLFIVPSIDCGNMIGKTLVHCAGAKMAGVIVGAAKPIVLTSRAENAEGKLNSLALACAIS